MEVEVEVETCATARDAPQIYKQVQPPETQYPRDPPVLATSPYFLLHKTVQFWSVQSAIGSPFAHTRALDASPPVIINVYIKFGFKFS